MSGREYPARPLVGLGIALFRANTVLLVRRGKAPAAGTWSLPGGAQRVGETAEAGARRELLEESGLEAGPLTLAAHVDSIHYDAVGRVQYHYTILDFAAPWVAGTPVAGGDATEAVFVSLAKLGRYGLWSEAARVIELGWRLISSAAAATATVSPD